MALKLNKKQTSYILETPYYEKGREINSQKRRILDT